MKKISVAQAQAFDRDAQNILGIPSLILMENAGRYVAQEAGKKKRVAIVCGMGNNGGDGLVAARHLLNAGVKIDLYMVGELAKLKTDPRTNFNILITMGQEVMGISGPEHLTSVSKADLIIDAIFGIGLKSAASHRSASARGVRGQYAEIIEFLNQSKKPILAVDVPSGLDADTGKVLGVAVKAKKTVTFVAAKNGFFKAAGPKHCGKIVVRDIGIV